MVVVAAFYKFVSLINISDLNRQLLALTSSHEILGTILIAHEGVNGTVAGSRAAIDELKRFFTSDSQLSGMEYKESFCEESPFRAMKVFLKNEVVTFGKQEVDPRRSVGTYVDASQWNKLLEDPDVMIIDVRNDYEVGIGTFKNAKNPQTKTFREFATYVKNHLDPKTHKKIAMCCTGGIRCEKASSFLLNEGFKEVFHLKGGILKYMEEMPKEQSLWQGECFVFDQRISLDHDLKPGSYALCQKTGNPIKKAMS